MLGAGSGSGVLVAAFSEVVVALAGIGTADADPAALVTTGQALSAVHDWTSLLSHSLMPVFNALCLGSVLYRSALVPRILPALPRRPC